MGLLWKAVADHMYYGRDKKRALRHQRLIHLQVWTLWGWENPTSSMQVSNALFYALRFPIQLQLQS